MEALDMLAWPVGRLGEAMAGLARLQGWQLRGPEAQVCPSELAYNRPEALHGWMETAAAWLMAWGLLLVTMIPLRLWSTWAQGRLAFGVGGLLKTRLLAGTLRLAPEEMRHQRAGQFLGRVLEADAVEGLALSGGLLGLLAALLTGLRQPESGLLLLDGLDLPTLGATGWRQRVVAVPQFHDNHLFTGTLAFNLLMGRHWPPQPADLQEAEALCRALELGPLLDRMPAGMWQLVGETGWQLSHGERSRLYIARALLQGAPILILDESFAALDPETLHRVHQCVLDRAPTLMVIAHP